MFRTETRYAGIFLLLFALIGISPNLRSQVIHIPDDFTTIQEGISSSQNGDTVLVSPGEYFENLNMMGKNILLTSMYSIDGNLDHINNTIINGSRPTHTDSASCILIVTGEDENCVISGFTLTGGKGTRWEDEHGIGNWYTEGGGILIQSSSPTIRNNVIRDNEALTRNSRNVSAGGGAIRMGDSNPTILNNFIHHNKGRYGGGLVLNYSGAVIKNNIISNNSGGQDFGGGGIWIYNNSAFPKIIENNTIVYNSSSGPGGGLRIWSTTAILTNNIIRGNIASLGAQVLGLGTLTFNNIEGGKDGEGNIDELITFESSLFYLPEGDNSIDAGNPHVSFNDPEDPDSSGNAFFPSRGSLRNDMGAYGGPGAQEFPVPDLSGKDDYMISSNGGFLIYPNPAHDHVKISFSKDLKPPFFIELINVVGQTLIVIPFSTDTNTTEINIKELGVPKGIHFLRLVSEGKVYGKKLLVN